MRVAGELAHLVEDRRGLAKLCFGEPRLAHERVQVLDQRNQDRARPRVRSPFHHRERVRGDLFVIGNDHSARLRARDGRMFSATTLAPGAGINSAGLRCETLNPVELHLNRGCTVRIG